jgi:predicted phosphodiesterase
MKIAVISDIHGNYPAFLSVVNDAKTKNADSFILLGDYIFDLPFPNETAELLASLENAHIIKGNKEAYLSLMKSQDQSNWVYDQIACLYHTYGELRPFYFDFMNDLPDEMYIKPTPDITIYAKHYIDGFRPLPKNKCRSSVYHKQMLEKPFTRDEFLERFSDFMNDDECRPLIEAIPADVILFGHNHLQSHCYVGDKLIINPGSCGQPLDFNRGAAYTVLEIDGGAVTVHETRVSYDVESVIERSKESAMYKRGGIWMDLVFRAIESGKDYFGFFFEIANGIRKTKGEEGYLFTNETWKEADAVFRKIY